MPKAPTGADLARKLLDKFPDAPLLQLARKLKAENVERFSTVESARTALNGVTGRLKKKPGHLGGQIAATHPRPKRDTTWSHCPPSLAEPWTTHELKGRRILCLSDIHVPFHDVRALTTAIQYAREELKPDCVFINGDGLNFYSLSKYDKNPARVGGLAEELRMGREVVDWIRGAFPRARMTFKLGNHEERLNKFIWGRAPELLDVAPCRIWETPQFAGLKCEWVECKRIVMAGKLPILHGHEFYKGLTNPVNPARGAYNKTHHTVLVAHLHRASMHPQPDMFGSETTCWSQGCLCDLHPDYSPINDWTHGFAFVNVANDGEFEMHNFKIAKGGKVRTV